TTLRMPAGKTKNGITENDNQDIFLSSLARQRNKIAFSLSGPMRCESLHALVLLRYDCIRAQ
ncbi:hypothetical protein ALP91_00557, partial [Pseudomonas savastanoi pv. glycinea]